MKSVLLLNHNDIVVAYCNQYLVATFWGFVSGGVKDALTFGLRLMFVDITEP